MYLMLKGLPTELDTIQPMGVCDNHIMLWHVGNAWRQRTSVLSSAKLYEFLRPSVHLSSSSHRGMIQNLRFQQKCGQALRARFGAFFPWLCCSHRHRCFRTRGFLPPTVALALCFFATVVNTQPEPLCSITTALSSQFVVDGNVSTVPMQQPVSTTLSFVRISLRLILISPFHSKKSG